MTTKNSTSRFAFPAALLACFLLSFSACGIPQLRCPKPGPVVPVDFNGKATSESSAVIGPHEFFNDPHLSSLIDQGLVGNQELKILLEDIQIANNEILRRRGMLLPFISAAATAGVEKNSRYTPRGAADAQLTYPGGRNFPDRPLPNFLLAADVTWQIDIWRQLRNARDAATLRYLGTGDGVNYMVTRLVADIAENYYELLSLDQQLNTLDRTIALQLESLEIAKARKEAARDTELAVQRFQAEVRKNQSEKFVVSQRIIEAENRINFLVGRYPQAVERRVGPFIDLQLQPINVGIPSQLLRNRPDIRQAERELRAAGLDIQVARANFFPRLVLTAGVGYEAFNPKYLFTTPESLIYNAGGGLVAPLVNRSGIKADYMNANAMQLQALYNYQRVVLNAFTEVVNQVSRVENYGRSIDLKRQQLDSLESAVAVSSQLFQNARIEYIDVLFAQRDRNEARMTLIDAKREQLTAVVNAYQALGGGLRRNEYPPGMLLQLIDTADPAPDDKPAAEELPPPGQPQPPVPPQPPVQPQPEQPK